MGGGRGGEYAWKEIFPTSLARNVVGGHHNTLRSALAASETLICSVHYSQQGGGRLGDTEMCAQIP